VAGISPANSTCTLGVSAPARACILFATLLWACGPSEPGGDGAKGGASGTNGTSGVSGSGGISGAAALGGSAGAAGGSRPTSCTTLTPSAPVDLVPSPEGATGWWYFAGTDGDAALIAFVFDRLVRIVRASPDGTTEVLLGETEYTPNWSFSPSAILALRTPDGIDVLLDDDSGVSIVRKRGATVSVVELMYTSYLDIDVLALAQGAAGPLAVYSRGEDPQRVVVVDLEQVLASDTIPTGDRVLAIDQASPTFPAPAGLMVAPADGAIWLGVERLDLAQDCTDTGQTTSCGDAEIPVLSCTWHVDLYRVTGAGPLPIPVMTLPSPAEVSRCDELDPTSSGLATLRRAVRNGRGIAHHSLAVDPVTQRLALALQTNDLTNGAAADTVDIDLGSFDSSGAPLFDAPPLRSSLAGESGFLATKDGVIVYCSDEDCAQVNATGSSRWNLMSSDFDALGVVPLPDGIGLIGDASPTSPAPVSLLRLTCGP
jgi:hypothetical protein